LVVILTNFLQSTSTDGMTAKKRVPKFRLELSESDEECKQCNVEIIEEQYMTRRKGGELHLRVEKLISGEDELQKFYEKIRALGLNEFESSDFKRMGSMLGRGSFGRVEKVMNVADRTTCVIKTVSVDTGDDRTSQVSRRQVLNELSAYSKLQNCLFIVQCYGIIMDERNGEIGIVLEYMDQGSLENTILNEDEVSKVAEAVLQALAVLKQHNLVHNDIKPANILANSQGEFKLGDFGCCSEVKEQYKLGTPAYKSPERMMGQAFSFESDIWAFGMTVYCFLTGNLPFEAKNELDLLLCVTKDHQFDFPERISENIRNLVIHCLERNPQDRTTVEELLCSPAA
jgi:mitogen-activated protein kinase kinase 1